MESGLIFGIWLIVAIVRMIQLTDGPADVNGEVLGRSAMWPIAFSKSLWKSAITEIRGDKSC